MSVTGLCQVCEQAEAIHQCNRCGGMVCESHWAPESGLCVDCAAETGRGDDVPGVR